MKKLSKIVTQYLKSDSGFIETLEMIKGLLQGDIWLVGGKVFRPIIKELYKIPFDDEYDFDFIVENPIIVDSFKLPDGWKVTKTGLGEPRLINDKKQIDLIFLDHAVNNHENPELKNMTKEDKLNSYFSKVPLNIQAIAYNIQTKKVIGGVGIRSILDKTIAINCLPECIQFCKRRKISIRKFLNTKVKGEIFTRIYPSFKDTEQTKDYYDKNATNYAKKYSFQNFAPKYFPNEINYFLEKLKGKRILDVGAGFGRDSMFFVKNGFKPLAIDSSKQMVELCKAQGLESEIQNIENCTLDNNQFDGVYAYCSLLHIPKERISNSLARITELMKPEGLFFIGMLEGNSEEIFDERYFSKYSKEELENILKDYFKILKFKKFSIRSQTYLNFVCSKI